MSNRGNRAASSALACALFVSVTLSACSSGPAPAETLSAASPTAAASAATTSSTPATPAPLDARSAWNACAQVAQTEYVDKNDGSSIRPFSETTTLQTDGDGKTFVIVAVAPAHPIEGVGSIAIICSMSGTADAPHVDKWIMKDI
ncbi:hypothetical protein [uncultured Leifsonia sp.]|uniref:hypothetical protein n=1 Tax=uncultured Leifsonia sp. TaxID=340359 RepID=UPI0025CCD60C|nr:hypothetical protein [uncultured Leifsonia sp.]